MCKLAQTRGVWGPLSEFFPLQMKKAKRGLGTRLKSTLLVAADLGGMSQFTYSNHNTCSAAECVVGCIFGCE